MTASGQQPCPPGAGSVLLREFWIQQMLPEKKKKKAQKNRDHKAQNWGGYLGSEVILRFLSKDNWILQP